MTTWESFGVTLLLLLGHTLVRGLIHKSLMALGQSRQVSENRVLYVEHVFHFLLGCATLLILVHLGLMHGASHPQHVAVRVVNQTGLTG